MWDIGAISTAEWEGVPLKEFLMANGINHKLIDKNNINHIHFESIDGVKISIPISKVFDTEYGGDVILAYKMNGEELNGHELRNYGTEVIHALKKITAKIDNAIEEGKEMKADGYKYENFELKKGGE